MSQPLSYQSLLGETIHDLVTQKKLGIEQIMTQVMESIMQAERELFLQTADANKGNGYYSRLVKTFQGQLQLRVPRDRQGFFRPLMLEVLQQDNERLEQLALSLYSQGVSHRGVKAIFSEIFQTAISPGKLSQLVKAFEPHRQAWCQRKLASHYHAVLIDAVHQPIRRDTVACEALYVVVGLTPDFTREILGFYQLPQETAAGWETVFADLTARGLTCAGLVLSDELSGIEQAVATGLPHHHHQLCLLHKIRNLMLRVRHSVKGELANDWQHVLGLDDPMHTAEVFKQRLSAFIDKWSTHYPRIRRQLPEEKWSYYAAYLAYPFSVRRMLYTTNWIERLNKEIRKVIRHVNSFPNAEAALNLVFMATRQIEEQTYSKPITSFYPYQDLMNQILYREQTQ